MNKQRKPDNQKSLHKNLQAIDKEIMDNGEIGLNRVKAKNLLLPSQIESMKEIFERLDRYND